MLKQMSVNIRFTFFKPFDLLLGLGLLELNTGTFKVSVKN